MRELNVGGRQVAYWNAPSYYGPWSGGYYSGFGGIGGGFLGGLFVGEMLGGWGGGWGGDTYIDPTGRMIGFALV